MKTLHNNSKLITSWDDGHPMDLKVAEILHKNKIPAIFYIPITNPQGPVMSKSEIRQIGSVFEIGAHTYTHVDLTKVTLSVAKDEVLKGKEELESILGRKIYKFAYPFGHYNKEVVKIVKSAGFKRARTARLINFHKDRGGFQQDPNLHLYNHSLLIYLAHCFKKRDLFTFSKVIKYNCFDFERALNYMQKFDTHVWGHSWEIDEKGLWGKLKYMVKTFS